MTEPRGREKPRSQWALVWKRYHRSKLGLLGLMLVAALLLVALLAPVLANPQPILCRLDGKIYAPALKEVTWAIPGASRLLPKSPPFNQATFRFAREFDAARGDWQLPTPVPHGPTQTSSRILERPSDEYLLGTDESGRDVLARMIWGARVSMLVGFAAMAIATTIGLVVGSLAGYFGGWVDATLSRIVEIVICFPVFFLILGIMAWLPKPSIWNVMIVLGLVGWVGIARYVRGEFMRLKRMDFAIAAVALGAGTPRIIFRHVLPNALAPVFVPITFGIASAILTESALSWLGFGVQPPAASWGSILRSAFDNILTTSHLVYPPCVAIFVAVLAYNLVGDRLRDVVDPRLRGSR
jgi:peptide/nickel transport system permease protein